MESFFHRSGNNPIFYQSYTQSYIGKFYAVPPAASHIFVPRITPEGGMRGISTGSISFREDQPRANPTFNDLVACFLQECKMRNLTNEISAAITTV
jgi:hypothetical protein